MTYNNGRISSSLSFEPSEGSQRPLILDMADNTKPKRQMMPRATSQGDPRFGPARLPKSVLLERVRGICRAPLSTSSDDCHSFQLLLFEPSCLLPCELFTGHH